jgi:hypothetical protein
MVVWRKIRARETEEEKKVKNDRRQEESFGRDEILWCGGVARHGFAYYITGEQRRRHNSRRVLIKTGRQCME